MAPPWVWMAPPWVRMVAIGVNGTAMYVNAPPAANPENVCEKGVRKK